MQYYEEEGLGDEMEELGTMTAPLVGHSDYDYEED